MQKMPAYPTQGVYFEPMKPTANGAGSLSYRVLAGEDIECVRSPKHERMASR